MKKVADSRSILDRYLHGFYLAKKYFQGDLKKEILVTIYYSKGQETSHGYMYLCERNVLLFVQRLNNESNVLWEFEDGDQVKSVSGNTESLTKIFNQTSQTERNINIVTTNPIKYLQVNDEYLILCDVQPDFTYGRKQLNFKTIILTRKNDPERVDNLVKVIDLIFHKKAISWETMLPGLSKNLAYFNLYFLTVGFALSIIFIFLLPLIDVKIGLITWLIILLIFWRIKSGKA